MSREHSDSFLPPSEIPQEMRKFSIDAREALKKNGFIIIELSKKPIKYFRTKGIVTSSWHGDESYSRFEAITSENTQVAVSRDPKQFILEDSNNKSLEEQEEMVKNLPQIFHPGIRGIEARIAGVPDHLEIAEVFAGRVGKRIFGSVHTDLHVRTSTKILGSYALIGNSTKYAFDDRLEVSRWPDNGSDPRVWASVTFFPSDIKESFPRERTFREARQLVTA